MNWIKQNFQSILLAIFFAYVIITFQNMFVNRNADRQLYFRQLEKTEELINKIEIENLKIDSLGLANKKLDSLIRITNKELKYLKGQNEAIYHKYNNINIQLPEL